MTPLSLEFQLEAAWALTNVASGTSGQTQAIKEKGGIKAFVRLLHHRVLAVAEQAIWAIGNIAAEHATYRDDVLSEGALDGITKLMESNYDNLKVWKHGTWALSNLCRGRPAPVFTDVWKSLPYLSKSLGRLEDPDTISDILWAMTYLSGNLYNFLLSELNKRCRR